MPKPKDGEQDSLKLSKATVRKINKVATGPLLGPVAGKEAQRPAKGELATKVAPLGSMVDVQARLKAAQGGEASPPSP
ncbi:MAG: hypothetical protein JWM80_5071 [Cyanobacteria bacterium RYN_339]|nr:hypothetical protein [Cyanobacteria bacterium RYN_339]